MLNRRHQSPCANLFRLGLMITGLLAVGTTAFAVDEPAPAAAPAATPDAPPAPPPAGAPIGRFLTLPAPLTEASLATLQNVLVSLRDRSTTESRPASLVLEIPSGSSRSGLVRDLLSLLTSAEYSAVRLVAWIPEPINGNHATLCLPATKSFLNLRPLWEIWAQDSPSPPTTSSSISRWPTVAATPVCPAASFAQCWTIHPVCTEFEFAMPRGLNKRGSRPQMNFRSCDNNPSKFSKRS